MEWCYIIIIIIIIIMWIYKAQQIHKSARGAIQNKLTLQYYIQHNLQINYLIYKCNLIYKKIKHQQKQKQKQKQLGKSLFQVLRDPLKWAREGLFLISAGKVFQRRGRVKKFWQPSFFLFTWVHLYKGSSVNIQYESLSFIPCNISIKTMHFGYCL